MHSGPESAMVNSSPVRPHELQVQSLIGEMTTSSLRVLATTRNYNSNEARSIGPIGATSFKAVATADGEKSQAALWSELSDRSSSAPERLLLDAIAAGELDEHLVALADAVHARRALLHTVRAAKAIAQLCIGDPVQINRNVRPGYLHGEHGVIVDLHDHAVTVRLRRPVGRFRSGELRCPPLALDKLDRPTWQPAA
jgi:hypothetical protein